MRIGRAMSWMVLVVVLLCVGRAWGEEQGGGVRGYAPSLTPVRAGAWTVLNGWVVNASDEPVRGMMVVSEMANRDVQFMRSVWVPAKSVLRFPVPFITTGDKYQGKFETETRVVVTGGEGGEGGTERDLWKASLPLGVDDGDSSTGIYWAMEDNGPPELLMQLRDWEHRKGGLLASFDGRNRPFPSGVLGLLSLPDLVIATSERLTLAQAIAVRQWVAQGGSLWIMADRVRPETARMILGDDWTCEAAEETELSRITLAEVKGGGSKGETFRYGPYETPIRMVRMVATGMEVTHKIEGWPAIMWRSVGRGQLVVTTFDMVGMGFEAFEEKRPGQKGKGEIKLRMKEEMGFKMEKEPEWLMEMLERFLSPVRAQPPGAVTGEENGNGGSLVAMHGLAASLVGHEVVRRGPVLGILGTLCVLLLGLGCFFQWRRRLEYLAGAAVVLSVAATGAMLVLGAVSKGSDPLTIAAVNEARVMPTLGLATFAGAADVYSPSAFEGTMCVPAGAWILPELRNQAGHIVRMSWGELSPMQWRYLRFPSGATLRGTVGGVMPLEGNWVVSGTFGAEGFEGTAKDGALVNGKDMLLIGPSGRLAPRIVEGRLVAGAGDQLAGGDVGGGGGGLIPNEGAEGSKGGRRIVPAAPV
ncbi:MAG: hypothetical protein FWD61_11025, partial [Phycisphaerales bacterium]|nr:hypothetical protein [Phycisphaerales bacterium]